MKAGLVFTGTGPIVILTNCDSLDDPRLAQRLSSKGIDKFIAYEVPIDMVKDKYGLHFSVTMADRKQTDDLRVVDWEGYRVLHNFPLGELGEPIYHETTVPVRRAA